jgi:arginine utilization protein RocB
MTLSLSHRVKDLTLKFVHWPSITGTQGETDFAHKLHGLLAQHPYFQAHPQHLWLQRTIDDAHERYNVIALVRGNGSRTVALAGHFDTVPVNDYGALAALATAPDALLPALIDDLRRRDDPASKRALEDLLGGDFMPGRAALDMKSGVAVGMAVLEQFAEQAEAEREGNVMLIATPDEEGSSSGMRSAVAELPAWLAQHDLSLEAVINLDATNDSGDGSAGRSIYLGSTGKLLASVMFVGQVAHTGNPFAGISAAFLAGWFVHEIDYNPAYGDALNGVAAPPPASLRLRDGKQAYDVTTPMTAWCAVNLLSHQRAPEQTLAVVRQAAQVAMEDALATISTRAERSGVQPPLWLPRVLTYAELRAHAIARANTRADEPLRAHIHALEAHTAREGDPFDWLRHDQQLVEALWDASGLHGPAAIVCLAAPFYPLVTVDEHTPKGARLMEVIRHQSSLVVRETGQSIQLRPIFLGTSDMSFFAQPMADAARQTLLDTVPTRATKAHIAGHMASTLDAPVVNVGPWGRDYHQRTERLYMPYAFGVLPKLVWGVVTQVLSDGKATPPERFRAASSGGERN